MWLIQCLWGNVVKWHAKISSLVKVGPFKNLNLINDNAYQFKLSSDILTPHISFHIMVIPLMMSRRNSRENSFEEGGTDAAQNTTIDYLDKREELKVYKRNYKRAN
ncbi:hypothetical protein AMTRI_Chr03g144470 [Amborella trichopoda]